MITNKNIEKYIENLLPDRPKVFKEVEDFAKSTDFPIIGPMVGSFLYLITKLSKAEDILELGSGFAYSAAWFAYAAQDHAKIICTENDIENIEKAQRFFSGKKFWEKITFLHGDALEESEKLTQTFDIIFCDIDKWEYPNALNENYDKLKTGGCFIFDNTLWDTKVLEARSDRNTVGIQELNRILSESNDFYTMIYPIRDGVTVAYKLR